jgi:hypothetical protein
MRAHLSAAGEHSNAAFALAARYARNTVIPNYTNDINAHRDAFDAHWKQADIHGDKVLAEAKKK